MFQDYGAKIDTGCKWKNMKYSIRADSIRKAMAQNNFEIIESYFGTNISQLKILEIGTGVGNLAFLLAQNSPLYQGIEQSKEHYNQAISDFPNLKGKVLNCSLENANFKSNYFDLIIMIDLLEHVYFPQYLLQQTKRYLKRTGVLYLQIPNEDWFIFRAHVRKLLGGYSRYPTNPGHVNLFTIRSLKKMLEMTNLGIQKSTQLTVLSDYGRVKIIFGFKFLFLAKLVCIFFKITKLDILLNQGNFSLFLKKFSSA